MEFKITGIIIEKESRKVIPGLLVRAFDKDLLYSDLLGNAISRSNGTFSIGYEGEDFQELFEKRPDIYLVIYGSATARNPGRVGDEPIYTTKHYTRFNAGRQEHFMIEIPREQLKEDSPSMGIVPTPEPGEWKKKIDDYIKTHPINFQFNSEKGFASPRLECTSHFGPEIINIGVGDSTWVTVRVTNVGNGVSFFSYIQVYEGPRGYTSPVRDYRLSDYRIITINPGQTVDVKLYWSRLLANGRIVGVCFDPFLDPRGFSLMEQYHTHITSIHYYP